MKVLITGAKGFIGKNLVSHLRERSDIEIIPFTRECSHEELAKAVDQTDFIFHLAGVNRPTDVAEFATGNRDLTNELCRTVQVSGRKIPILYTSSIQAERDNSYGVSKKEAEESLLRHQDETGGAIHIFRLPNVFGKWCRPNYNSAVATFCHNIARDLPIQINDPSAKITLVYVDDVIDSFIELMEGCAAEASYCEVQPQYSITVGELADQIRSFHSSRETLISERVGSGLTRALYATYMSYLPPESFTYVLPKHGDQRGVFVEMLKTKDSGQFSFFTAHPGITRGGHYHHSKTEKFLVIRGKARFRFRHILSDERYELITSGEVPEVVETVPGWSHDVTNIGEEEMIVMLWANEIFDREKPDTFALVTG